MRCSPAVRPLALTAAHACMHACMHHTRSQALTAAQSGAAVLNHCEVVSLLTSGTPGEAGYRITGARLKARPSINRRQLRPALVRPPVGGWAKRLQPAATCFFVFLGLGRSGE